MARQELIFNIGANTRQFIRKMNGVKQHASKTANFVSNSLAPVLGGAMAGGAATFFFRNATIEAMAFHKGMAEVNTIAKLSKKDLDELKLEVVDLSMEIGHTTETLTKGLYDALSAGVPKDNAISFLRTAGQAATAGVTDVKTSVNGLTNVINAWKLDYKDAAKVADVFFETVRIGKTTFPELANNIGQVATMANKVGYNFEETAAALARMTKNGLSTAEATTALRGVIKEMLAPNDALKAQLIEIARSQGLADTSSLSLQKTMKLLGDAVNNDSEALKQFFPDVRGLNGALQLTGTNAQGAASDLAEISAAAGAAGEAFKTMSDDASFKVDKMAAAWKALAITIGTEILPAVAEYAEYIADTYRYMIAIPKIAKEAGVNKDSSYTTASTSDDAVDNLINNAPWHPTAWLAMGVRKMGLAGTQKAKDGSVLTIAAPDTSEIEGARIERERLFIEKKVKLIREYGGKEKLAKEDLVSIREATNNKELAQIESSMSKNKMIMDQLDQEAALIQDKVNMIRKYGGKEKLANEDLVSIREAINNKELAQIATAMDKKIKAEEKAVKTRERAAKEAARIEKEIARMKSDDALDAVIDSERGNIEKWRTAIEDTEKEIRQTANLLGSFGGNLKNGLFTGEDSIKREQADDELRKKIEWRNKGKKVSFTADEQKRINELERKRQDALVMKGQIGQFEDMIAQTRTSISSKQIARNQAFRNQRLVALQEKLGVARDAAGNIDNIRKGNEPIVAAIKDFRQMLEQKLPGVA